MQVYHLTIHENGHSRRFVFEDRDEALNRLADAIAAGLDAKLDEVVRAPALPKPTESDRRAGRNPERTWQLLVAPGRSIHTGFQASCME
jgi:hypothetical protein